jgi:hypothetical protein
MGLSRKDFDALPEAQKRSDCERIAKSFLEAGADIVLDSVADLPELFSRS